MASLTTSPERLGAALGQLSHAKANFLKNRLPQHPSTFQQIETFVFGDKFSYVGKYEGALLRNLVELGPD